MTTQRAVITFERGLDEYKEPTRLQPGEASVLQNWTPEADGSLRSRVGWRAQANGGQPTNRQVRGIGLIRLTGVERLYVASRSTDSELVFYWIDNADLAAATAMTLRDTVSALAPQGGAVGGLHHRHYVPMVNAFGRILYANHAFYRQGDPAGGIREWNGSSTPSWTLNSRDSVGRALCFYRDRIYTGGGDGSDAARARLKWSGLADRTMWDTADLNNPAGEIFVAQGESGQIECITPFKDGILIGKTHSLWYLVGRNPFNAQLEQMDAGNAAPGKSLCITPYGAFVAGKNQFWLFDGRDPLPMKKRVSSSYGLTGEYLTTAYMDGCVYIADQGKDDILVYDIENDSWRKESFAKRIATLFTLNDRLLGGPTNATDFPLLGYRDIPNGTRVPDAVSGTTYKATTPRSWFGNTIGPVTVRHAYLKVRQRGTTGPGLTVRTYKNDVLAHTKVVGPEPAAGVHRHRIDVGPTDYAMHWDLEQTLTAGQASNVDIEEIIIEYDAERPR